MPESLCIFITVQGVKIKLNKTYRCSPLTVHKSRDSVLVVWPTTVQTAQDGYQNNSVHQELGL